LSYSQDEIHFHFTSPCQGISFPKWILDTRDVPARRAPTDFDSIFTDAAANFILRHPPAKVSTRTIATITYCHIHTTINMAAAAGALVYGMAGAAAPIAQNIKNIVVDFLSPSSDIIVISHIQPHARTLAPKNPVFLIVSAITGLFTTPPPPTRQVVVTKILQVVRQPPTTTAVAASEAVEFGYGLHIALFGFLFALALLYSLYARSQVATHRAAASEDFTSRLRTKIEKQQRRKKRLENRLVALEDEVDSQKSHVDRLLRKQLHEVASLQASKTEVEEKLRKAKQDGICQLQLADTLFREEKKSYDYDMAVLVAQHNADALRWEKEELKTSTRAQKGLEEKVLEVEQEGKLQLELVEHTLREEIDSTALLISQHNEDSVQWEKELEASTRAQKGLEEKVSELEQQNKLQLALHEERDAQHQAEMELLQDKVNTSTQAQKDLEAKVLLVEQQNKLQLALHEELDGQHQADMQYMKEEVNTSKHAQKILEEKVLSVEQESKQQLQLTENALREELGNQLQAEMESLREEEEKSSTQALEVSTSLQAALLSVQQESEDHLQLVDKALEVFKATAAEGEKVLRAEMEALREQRDQLASQVAERDIASSAQSDTIAAQQTQIEELSSQLAEENAEENTPRPYHNRGGRTRLRGVRAKFSDLEEKHKKLLGEMELLRKELKALKGEEDSEEGHDDGAEDAEESKIQEDRVGAEGVEQDVSCEANAATEVVEATEEGIVKDNDAVPEGVEDGNSEEANAATEVHEATAEASQEMSQDFEAPGQQLSTAPSPPPTLFSPPTGPSMPSRGRRPIGGPQPRAGRLAAQPFVLARALQGEGSLPAAAEAVDAHTETTLSSSPSPSPSVVLPTGPRHQYAGPHQEYAGHRLQYPDPRQAGRQIEVWRPAALSTTPAGMPLHSPLPATTPTGPRDRARGSRSHRGSPHYQQQHRQPQRYQQQPPQQQRPPPQQRQNGLNASRHADPDFDFAQSRTEYKPF
jgi:hypothetical protein